MQRKANLGIGVLKIFGYIYTGLGSIFFLLGLALWAFIPDPDAPLIGMVFTIIGAAFLAVGIVVLLIQQKRQQQADRLLAAGHYVLGEVAELRYNTNVTINSHHPLILLIKCRDPQGRIHIYKSRNVTQYVDRSVIGQSVRVYTQQIGSKEYYVDLDGVLPQVIEH